MSDFISTHNLHFEQATQPWHRDKTFWPFRIGTCEGLYRAMPHRYELLTVINNVHGNGHFTDVLDWFYNSCRRDGKSLVFLELINPRFRKHLIEKHGFGPIDKTENLIKQLKDIHVTQLGKNPCQQGKRIDLHRKQSKI